MKLIIAEKPSLARSICAALVKAGESFRSCDGGEYQESRNYYVTAQFGHLLELLMPEEYEENKGSKYAPLPYFPDVYQFKVKNSCEKRFNTIRKLVKNPDVTEIIHCGDADREGQLLVDLVLERIGNQKPVTRPQFKATTPAAINSALKKRLNNQAYTTIRDEGYARMVFDFDYGINLSNYATRKAHAKPALNVGRVKGAILKELYVRDKEIKNFEPKKYYVAESKKDGIKLTSKKHFDTEKEAEEYASLLQSAATRVKEITVAPVTKKPPKLFSQTKLQSAMNKKYGYSPDETLKYAQSLYEKGLTTYPRTNTEYMTEAEIPTLKAIIDRLNTGGERFRLRTDKTVIDDKKVDGHSAIIVTGKRAENLSEGEYNCYMTILNRFRAVFCLEPCVYNKTTAIIHNPHEMFKLTGETMVTPGWQSYEPPKKMVAASKKEESKGDQEEESVLPPLKEDQLLETDFKPLGKTTTPPPKYTVTTLGSWMENPFKKRKNGNVATETEEDAGEPENAEEDNDDSDYENILKGLEIGTEATRAGILKTLQEKKYISLKKNTYNIEDLGIQLVEICEELEIDMSKETTALMGKTIKDVGKGNISLKDAIDQEHYQIREIIEKDKPCRQLADTYFEIGKCPICGKGIRENSKSYYCSNWKDANCPFHVWKKIAGKNITKRILTQLITKGETGKLQFKNKEGKEFSAKLKLNDTKSEAVMEFANKRK